MPTIAHVTHEAIEKIGGIGAVLQGMLTSSLFLTGISRNILVGPYWPTGHAGEHRLGPDGSVLYSSLDHLYRSELGPRFREIEETFDVRIVYGRRKFVDRDSGTASTPEVILIDVGRFDAGKIAQFKFRLWEQFGIESGRYEQTWDYEQWVRLGLPAIAALRVIGATNDAEPCVILSHEYMGIPTCLAALLEEDHARFRTIFHAHECATVRRIVELSPGHDTMFYNVMRAAMARGDYIDAVFGDQSDFYKHALVKAAQHLDGIFAVGDQTLDEIRFLGPEFRSVDAQVAYNGVPCWPIDLNQKTASRNKLRKYCRTLLKFEPDWIFTHVTRLVPSKGLWRDLRVLEHVEQELRARNETAVFFAVTTEAGARKADDIRKMEQVYRWPVVHREGHPDLSAGEADYYEGVQEFNACARNVKVVFINQFGFDPGRCGDRMPADMEFMDIRKGSDVEFGQSIYEPFGIAQVEPISFGGICVYTNVCGCAGLVEKAAGGDGTTHNVIVADYTRLAASDLAPEALLNIGRPERELIEGIEAKRVAGEILSRLPRTPEQTQAAIDRGYALARNMSWDVVSRDYLLPGIHRALNRSQRENV